MEDGFIVDVEPYLNKRKNKEEENKINLGNGFSRFGQKLKKEIGKKKGKRKASFKGVKNFKANYMRYI